MRARNNCKGMTLFEIMITVVIFGAVSLLISSMIITASQNYHRGKIMQDVRIKVSSAMKSIEDDIRRGYVLQTIGTGSWVPSAVCLPNPYGAVGPSQDLGEGRSRDRLIVVVCTRPNVDAIDITNPNADLRFVEYSVPSSNRRILQRRVFSVTTSGSGYNGFRRTGGQWLVDDAYFLSGSPTRSDQLINLEGRYDYMTFSVERPRLPTRDYLYNVDYDRNLYKLKVKVVRYMKDNLAQPVSYEEETTTMTMTKVK